MKVGVLSDTHIPGRAKVLPGVILEAFKSVDHIIHAGDIRSLPVIDVLEKLAPVTAVAGNVDPPLLNQRFGEKKILTFEKVSIGIFHGHGNKGKTVQRAIGCFETDSVDCIVFGHSHIPCCTLLKGLLLFNPGSPTDKRRETYYSFGILEINEIITPHLIFFDSRGIVNQPFGPYN